MPPTNTLPPPTVTLTPEQVAAYHRDGFLALPQLTTKEEVARLRTIYDELFARKAGRDEGNQFDLGGTDEDDAEAVLPQILAPSRYAPELATTLLRANAEAVAEQLLGPDARFTGDHAILKPARYGAATPWHQDEAYWNPALEYESISIWVPLQEATLENGCMQFLPGSQEWDVLTHRSIGDDPRVHGLELAADVDLSAAVACPLPPGGATVHGSRTLHHAGPNAADVPRRAYILGFGLPTRERAAPRDFPWNTRKQTAREQRRAASEAAAKA
jgi:ectoine hydroxylase-related dioxygenase (phytanoyl-CoA dioxygenase family)